MNEKELRSMWRDLSATPLAMILKIIVEAVLYNGPNQAIGSGDSEIWVDKGRKRRGEDMLKLGKIKGWRLEKELKIDAQKGYDPRVPIEIWDRRAWSHEG